MGDLVKAKEVVCAMCRVSDHRYGTSAPHHDYSATACVNSLLGEVERLRSLLAEVVEEFEDALEYVPEYFVEKWGYLDVVEKARKAS